MFLQCLQYNKEARDTQDLLKRMETEVNQKYSPEFKDMYQMDGLIRELDVSLPFVLMSMFWTFASCALSHTWHSNAVKDGPTDPQMEAMQHVWTADGRHLEEIPYFGYCQSNISLTTLSGFEPYLKE